MPKFKVTIDRDQCISDGVCWALCPQVFEMNPDDGKSQIVEEYRTDDVGTGVVPEDLGDCVKQAANSCPVQIIHVEEVEG